VVTVNVYATEFTPAPRRRDITRGAAHTT